MTMVSIRIISVDYDHYTKTICDIFLRSQEVFLSKIYSLNKKEQRRVGGEIF